MAEICPTITAETAEEYRRQVEQVSHFAHRLHIDLSDGIFAPRKLLDPEKSWWPVGIRADFHLMIKNPHQASQIVSLHQPNLIIVHAEADGDFDSLAEFCHGKGVKVGVALLAQTPAQAILPALSSIDHVLIFSGNLGQQGGSYANLELLNKLSILKNAKPELEVGWDGGVNDQNIAQLVFKGIDVINAGAFIQGSPEPERAFNALSRIADETATT